MKKLSEITPLTNFDLQEAYLRIERMLSELLMIYNSFHDPIFSVEKYLESSFQEWHLKGNFIDVSEMRRAIGIEKKILSKGNLTEERVLYFLQYAINCTAYVMNCFDQNDYSGKYGLSIQPNLVKSLFTNIKELISYLKADLIYDKEKCEFYISYSNNIADVISIQMPELKRNLTEYLLLDNTNDLERKRGILCLLYTELEPKMGKLEKAGFSTLVDNAGFLFNRANIRHSLKDDKTKAIFGELSDAEILTWYDRTFDLFLACMSLLPYVERHKDEINSIKQKFASS
jgi:hypothetical protein